MKLLICNLLRLCFKFKFLQKHFFGVYKKIIIPYKLTLNVETTVLINNIKFNLNLHDWVQTNIFFLGGYEKIELKYLIENLEDNSLIIDVGANIGWYSTNLAVKLNKGQVYSFEPFSQNYNKLISHIKLNKLNNVKPFKIALGQKKDILNINYNTNDDNLGMASIKLKDFNVSESVDVVALDEFLKFEELNNLKFIKIDIEGFEYEALKKKKKTLSKFKPMLLIEQDKNVLGDKSNDVINKIDAFLNELGYLKYVITNNLKLEKVNAFINYNTTNFIFKHC